MKLLIRAAKSHASYFPILVLYHRMRKVGKESAKVITGVNGMCLKWSYMQYHSQGRTQVIIRRFIMPIRTSGEIQISVNSWQTSPA